MELAFDVLKLWGGQSWLPPAFSRRSPARKTTPEKAA
jgi:hypothetical protein